MKLFLTVALSSLSLFAASVSQANSSYPSKPIRIVVPWAAGTGLDSLTRTIANDITHDLGATVLVENRVGAGGNIGTATVARAEPDGYTFVMGSNGPFAANKALYKDLAFDPITDFSPVILIGKVPMLLIGNPESPTKTVDELIQAARSNPGKLNFGASNTTARIWVELIKQQAGIDVETVLYSNAGGMLTDLMSGRIQYAFENVGTSLPLLQAQKLKGIAVTSDTRAPFAPELPTIAESSLTDPQLGVWFALFAPKGTPDTVIEKMNAAVNKGLSSPSVIRVAEQLGLAIVGGTSQELSAYQQTEVDKWQDLVTRTGVEIN